MDSGQKQSGRTLFPFGQISQTEAEFHVAFSLMRAVPFMARGSPSNQVLSWTDINIAAGLLACSGDQLPRTQKAFSEFLSGSVQAQRNRALQSLTIDGARYDLTYEITDADNRSHWLNESGERITGDGDVPTHICSVLRDVTEAREQRQRDMNGLRREVVTGLMSHDYFQETLGRIQTTGQSTQIIQLQLTNIDDLTSIYGPAAIDFMLQSLAGRLKGELAPTDMASFDGKDRFSIFFPVLSAEDILQKSKKISFIFTGIPVESPYGTITPDCRLAIETPRFELTVDDNSTDVSSGSAIFFGERKEITDIDVKLALDQDRFSLAYQPICKAQTREIAYYEALLRIKDGDGHLGSAFPYISAAEKLGLVNLIDQRTLSLAGRLLHKRSNIKLSINVSAGTVQDEDARRTYLKNLEKLGNITQRLTYELTETMAIDNMEAANLFSNAIRSMGGRLAIDDFGAGHTSFNNLMQLEAQIIKIDGSYIRDLSRNPVKQTFVRMIAEMADVFGLETVAEMIDNEADARLVERMGIGFLQGFHLGRPDAIET